MDEWSVATLATKKKKKKKYLKETTGLGKKQ
jgi:hypothetical protein